MHYYIRPPFKLGGLIRYFFMPLKLFNNAKKAYSPYILLCNDGLFSCFYRSFYSFFLFFFLSQA